MDYAPYDDAFAWIKWQLENGLDLTKQDRLRVHHIAQLEYSHKCKFFTDRPIMDWAARIETAVAWGVLPVAEGERPYHRMDNAWPHIGRDAYRTWRATQLDAPAGSYIHRLWLSPDHRDERPSLPLPVAALPAPAQTALQAAAAVPPPNPRKIDERVAAIVAALESAGIPPLAVPHGHKASLRCQLCKNPNLLRFSTEKGGTFDKAWQEAVKRGLVRMEDHDRYVGSDVG